MRVHRLEGADTRLVLGAIIYRHDVCSRIAPRWPREGLFADRSANLIAHWSVEYFRRYGRPPAGAIADVFASWAEGKGEEAIRSVRRLLEAVCGRFETDGRDVSADYVIDTAGKLFNRIRLRKQMDLAEAELDAGRVDDALARFRRFQPVELGEEDIFRPESDIRAWRDAYDPDLSSPIVEYPGALGDFLNEELVRDGFVSFLGATGHGKSWWLLDLACRAARQRRRVALFECGDMSRYQVVRRLGQRILRRPRRAGEVRYPVELVREGGGVEVRFRIRRFLAANARDSLRAWRKVLQGTDRFRLSCHPTSSLTAEQMAAMLSAWAEAGWVADVVVIDYADILAPPPGLTELRDQINETWKRLRRLSQELHCLVVTATQADARSYEKHRLGRINFSDDRRKNDHVTAMIGINTTLAEKEKGITRLNFLKRRDAPYSEAKEVYVAGCLAIGCPAIISCM